MDSDPNGKDAEIQTEDANFEPTDLPLANSNLNEKIGNGSYGSSSQKGLLEISGPLGEPDNKKSESQKPKKKFQGFIVKPSRIASFWQPGGPSLLISPSATFQRIAVQKDGISRATPTPARRRGLRDGFNVPFVGEVRWVFLREAVKKWLQNPKNLALLIWGIAVAVSGAILFLVMVGFLDSALPEKSQRDAWFEVNNQILNALFTMMCLYQHPLRCYHLSLLLRWERQDIVKLRKIYCKNGTYKPHEWAHIMIVVLLLHLNCFAQYALCGLNWGYKRSERPAVGVGICLSVAIGAPAAAGLYVILSPLGKDYETEADMEAGVIANGEVSQSDDSSVKCKPVNKLFEKRYSFMVRENKRMEPKPEWQGDLFDCWSDPGLAFFSTFALFCIFGWNMDRLGFGNMYVHTVTFILLCMAPFWIFVLAAINIDNELVREALGITGIILCVFGLLYGGFWRVRMRKRFGLPENHWCFGHATLTDFVQWLFCSACSLFQEVRTADFYEVCDDKLYPKQSPDSTGLGSVSPSLIPLNHEPRSPASLQTYVNSQYLSSNQAPLNGEASTSPIRSYMFSGGNSPVRETYISNSLPLKSEDAHKEADQMGNTKIKAMSAPIPLRLERD